MEELRIKSQIGFRDFLRFQFWILRKKYLRKLFIYAGLLLLLPVLLPLFLYGGFDSRFIFRDIDLFIPVLALCGFAFLLLITVYFSSKRVYESDKLIQKAQEFVFNAAGMELTTENSHMKLAWEEVNRSEESKSNFYIFISLSKSLIIPKRYLSDVESDYLRRLLSSGIKPEKKKGFQLSPGRKLSFVIIPVAVAIGVISGLHKNEAEKYFEKGYQKEQVKDFEGAILEYDEAISANGSYAKAYNHRGFSKSMSGNYTGGIEDCSKAISLENDYASAYNNLSYAKYELGDSVGACEDLHKALELGFTQAKYTIEQYCPK
jgi:tetratricopeptide (TPR) repeat protein